MNKNIIKHGFVLILFALISALFVPDMQIPRLGVSAHTIGVLSGSLMIAIGAIWSLFILSAKQMQIMYFSWLYSSYANWLGCLIGAVFGAGKMTPVAASGFTGTAVVEAVVSFMLMSVALTSLLAVGLSLRGLQTKKNI